MKPASMSVEAYRQFVNPKRRIEFDHRPWNARYRSPIEQRFHSEGPLFLQVHYQSELLALYFEPVRFRLPGGWVKLDFWARFVDGRSLFIELKGSREGKGYTASRARLKTVAGCYPTEHYCQILPAGKSWAIEEI